MSSSKSMDCVLLQHYSFLAQIFIEDGLHQAWHSSGMQVLRRLIRKGFCKYLPRIKVKSRVFLAPLAGYTNSVYRKIMAKYGAGFVVSEMISDKALCFDSKKTFEMIDIEDDEHPCALQIFGGEKEYLVKRIIADGKGADIFCLVAGIVSGVFSSVFIGNLCK